MSKLRASLIIIVALAFALTAIWAVAQTPKATKKPATATKGEAIKKNLSSAKSTAEVVATGSVVTAKVSGPGAINDSTIKAGQLVDIDIYFSNDKARKGFEIGFKLSSPDITEVKHVPDSGFEMFPDIKGYNGWQDNSIWDLRGVMLSKQSDWDGKLPDWIGMGGVTVKQRFQAQESKKVLSFNIIVPDPGTLVVDSTWFPPSMSWKYADNEKPDWKGPYKFKVVK
ncbi:MAG TPA: hypothetical protein VMS71_05505 [Candidatus Acidoferrum sp.]|nr:hypothetical protein [Candidatus Acidoferrum sp.]